MKTLTDYQKEILKYQINLLQCSKLKDREHESDDYSERDPFHRDYTRILYSSAFRRLQGKMQILGVESSAFFRNRLTHSLEVAQIARSIASNIYTAVGCDDKWTESEIALIEAAALAHDIGHPAFGHKGEKVLDEIAKGHGLRFEGNAQNFRVLRKLEKKEPTIKGLNLTNRTLLAINKYIVKEDNEAKKFLYKDDFEYLDGVRKDCQLENIRTIDVQIIDLADEIAYAVHDLEDSLALRYFNIDELLYEIKLKDQNAYQQFEHMVLDSKRFAGDSCSYKTIQEYSQVFRKRLTSVLTNEFINDVTILEVNDSQIISEHGTKPHQYELSLDKYKNLSKLLKSHIFSCVTRDSDIMLYEQKGEIIIKSLFELFSDKKLNKDGKLLPPDFRPNSDYSLVQGSIDYIAGMMDTFAISEYERFYKVKFSDIIIKDKNKNSITLIF